MPTFDELIKIFETAGAEILVDAEQLKKQLQQAELFIFDWDGVFNHGVKMGAEGSPYGEPDSMGTNLMRLSYYLLHGRMPKMGIITGAINAGSKFLAEREHYDFILRGFHDKAQAIEKLKNHFEVSPEKTVFVWDDLIDFPIAQFAKTSIQIKRAAHPLFNAFMKAQNCVSYVTANGGNENGIREISEIYLSANDNAEETFLIRGKHDPKYHVYIAQKKLIQTIEILNQ